MWSLVSRYCPKSQDMVPSLKEWSQVSSCGHQSQSMHGPWSQGMVPRVQLVSHVSRFCSNCHAFVSSSKVVFQVLRDSFKSQAVVPSPKSQGTGPMLRVSIFCFRSKILSQSPMLFSLIKTLKVRCHLPLLPPFLGQSW